MLEFLPPFKNVNSFILRWSRWGGVLSSGVNNLFSLNWILKWLPLKPQAVRNELNVGMEGV